MNAITKRVSEQPPNAAITISTKPIRAPSKHTNLYTERRYKEETKTETQIWYKKRTDIITERRYKEERLTNDRSKEN